MAAEHNCTGSHIRLIFLGKKRYNYDCSFKTRKNNKFGFEPSRIWQTVDKAYLHARALLIRPPPEKSASKKTDNSLIISIKYNSVIV